MTSFYKSASRKNLSSENLSSENLSSKNLSSKNLSSKNLKDKTQTKTKDKNKNKNKLTSPPSDQIQVSRNDWQQLQSSISLAHVGLLHISFEGKILWANPFFWNFLGYKENEISDLSLLQTSRPQDLKLQLETLQKLKNGEIELAEFDRCYLRSDGGFVWGHISGKLHRDENNQPKFVVSVVQDITARKETEGLLRTILRAVPSLIGCVDKDLKYNFVNQAYEKWFGLPADQIVGKTMYEILGEKAVAAIKGSIDKVLKGEYIEFERRLDYRLGGAKNVHLTYVPTLNPIGEVIGFVAIVQDLSDVRVCAEFGQDQHNRLVESARLAALGEMAAGLSHGINNPLAIIAAKTDQLLMKLESNEAHTPEKFRAGLLEIKETSQRISKIVKRLRSFSKFDEKEALLETHFALILEDTLALCSEKFKNHGVRLNISEIKDLRVKCRSLQISHVILNLLNNSFTAIRQLEDKWIQISVRDEPNRLLISITDSGKGLNPEVISKILNSLFAGSGLSTSRRIIEEHGGQLFYDSSSLNTTFVIELPRHQNLQMVHPI